MGDDEKAQYQWEKHEMRKGFRSTKPLPTEIGEHEWPEQQSEQP